jgi:hypothetical protein
VACEAEQGTCSGDGTTCDIPPCFAAEADCTSAGGTCSEDGTTCEIPACLAAEADCTAAGGVCSEDGSTCNLPACNSDEDCQGGQPGAYCVNPGDLELAECKAPDPGEVVPPGEVLTWSAFRITDSEGNVLADASAGNQRIAIADVPEDGLVRIYGDYGGPTVADTTTAYLHVQMGSQTCELFAPHADAFPVELVDAKLASGAGDYVEFVLSGGYQKLLLSNSEKLGAGDMSYVIEIGEDTCAPPQHPFIATLTWDAGPGKPADLDLNVWNAAGELVAVGSKQAAWGQLKGEDHKGPGPEVFEATDVSQGPFTIKVQFFSGKPRTIEGKVRITRTVAGEALDETFSFTVEHPKDVAEIGVFAAQ